MNAIPTIELRLAAASGSGFVQSLAGETVWCDQPLTHDAVPAPPLPSRPDRSGELWEPVYDGPGLLAGSVERIRSWMAPSGAFRVDHDDGERFEIEPGGTLIVRHARGGGAARNERLLGAPLAVALAMRGTYLLHASAVVMRSGDVVAFTAESGGGKSTLAAHAARLPDRALSRIADDQLPVRLAPVPQALPRFPQPKLSNAEQYSSEEPPALRLGSLIAIEVKNDLAAPQLRRATASEALRILVGATVAAKLFDGTLLARHFAACAAAAPNLTVARLQIPFGLERIEESLRLVLRSHRPVSTTD